MSDKNNDNAPGGRREGHAMSDEQLAHATSIAIEFRRLMLVKYAKGQREHGGNLWENPASILIRNALDEAIDQVVYLITLKEQVDRKESALRNLIAAAENRIDSSARGKALRRAIVAALPGGEPELRERNTELEKALDLVHGLTELRAITKKKIRTTAGEVEAILRNYLDD